MEHRKILPQLLLTFSKIGLFTFGGGYAMISLIEDICVEQKRWISHEDMANVTVIAESTPGPIAINCATFIGFRQAGFPGAVAATLGVVMPSFIILYLISLSLDFFLEIPVIAGAFQGIKLAVGILIINAGWTMLKKMKKTPFSVVIVLSGIVCMLGANLLAVKISSVVLMVSAGLLSLVLYVIGRKGGTP